MFSDYTWSYKKEEVPDSIRIEHILKYGDISEIKNIINTAGRDICQKIWSDKIIPDVRFSRLNYFLARFIFNSSEDKDDIMRFLKNHKRRRFEKT
jgi:NAD dependent epimerase/dehydratase family enzyme